jgi:hypothetical protein
LICSPETRVREHRRNAAAPGVDGALANPGFLGGSAFVKWHPPARIPRVRDQGARRGQPLSRLPRARMHIAPWIPEFDAVLDQVTLLFNAGIAVVPLCRPNQGRANCTAAWHEKPCPNAGKRPLISGYRRYAEELPSLDQLRYDVWRFWPCNIGIVVPTGMVVVEADSPDAERELVHIGGEQLLRTPCRERRPGRGRGFLFRLPSGWTCHDGAHLGRSGAIDVKAAASIFIIPPSQHASGHRYTWLAGLSPHAVPVQTTSAGLEILLRSLRASGRAGHIEPGASLVQMPSRAAFLISNVKAIRDLWEGKKSFADTSASGVDFSLARALLKAGLSVDEVAATIAYRPGAHRTDGEYCLATAIAAANWRRGRR